MNSLYSVLCDVKSVLRHIMSEGFHVWKHTAGSNHIGVGVLLLLLGASSSPWSNAPFGNETNINYSRTRGVDFTPAYGPPEHRPHTSVLSDAALVDKMPSFPASHTARITGIRG